MLRKLLKYDLLPTWRFWRIVAPIFFLSGLLMACLTRALLSVDPERDPALYRLANVGHTLINIVFVASLGAVVIGTLVMVLRRYIVSFCSDEGYLTFSLPVRRETLYLSKVLSCTVWDTAFGVLFLAVLLLWDVIAYGGANTGSLLLHLFVELDPVASAIGILLGILLFFAAEFFHVNLIYAMAGSAAGYTGRRVNAGRIVLLAVLMYYVVPVIESPLIILAIVLFLSATGTVAVLSNVLLATFAAAAAFAGLWLYFKNVRTLETRLNLS